MERGDVLRRRRLCVRLWDGDTILSSLRAGESQAAIPGQLHEAQTMHRGTLHASPLSLPGQRADLGAVSITQSLSHSIPSSSPFAPSRWAPRGGGQQVL